MTDILSHIRNASRACTDTYEVAMTINEARQLLALIDTLQAEADAAKTQWRCFHCSYLATNEVDARAHFGNGFGQPSCIENYEPPNPKQ